MSLGGGILTHATWRHSTAHAALHPESDVDPGLLLLGPLHRHAAAGFHLDSAYAAVVVRPVQGAARLVRFLDREVIDAYVRGAGAAPGCWAPPCAARRPATCRPTWARCWRARWSLPSPPYWPRQGTEGVT